MVKFLTLSVLFLIQGIHSFCIYNHFTDGSSFNVKHKKPGTNFEKHLEMGTLICCPHTDLDCSQSQNRNDEADFTVDLHFASGNYSPLKFATCTVDGGLVIYGTEKEHFAKCIYASEVTIPIPLRDS